MAYSTLEQVLHREAIDRYTDLTSRPGEPRTVRTELGSPAGEARGRRSLLYLAHLTDIHTVDVQSPGRYEFMQRFAPKGGLFHLVVPSFRPQEALNLHALEVMLRTLNGLDGSPDTGAGIQFVLCTGDHTDNQQHNELRQFMAVMNGGSVRPCSGGTTYEGVQSTAWGDDAYWHPDSFPDVYKERWGFPEHPHLLEEAVQPFTAAGLQLPWLALYGNHDALVLGTALTNPEYDRLRLGSRKARAVPADFDPEEHLGGFVFHPDRLLSGPASDVTADPDRRGYSRREYIQAHVEAPGTPVGHGFTEENVRHGTTYYVHDASDEVRLVMLDFTNPGGHYQGSIGARQLAWLEQQLADVHSRYFDEEGREIRSGNRDRLVVICSHHSSTSLVNPIPTGSPLGPEEDDLPRLLGPAVLGVLHRFPNVILWLNGHTHCNTVRPRADPSGRTAGFWEVTTGSLLDWPNQGRMIEIVDNGNGTLSVLCTMINHRAPADPSVGEGIERLAALHRQLAANDPYGGMHVAALPGDAHDRNVELLLPQPGT